ncbi:hypothetical protein EYF80_012332 [Liparis tanakae]|uniref:Uncharacterized protein n=1 Tax=Liparis tanakae TaxID=230148 RepID=A0A4Z2II38_9TELE|nr:hypothetical protein EYF80_012332 [Liparis tanakae]
MPLPVSGSKRSPHAASSCTQLLNQASGRKHHFTLGRLPPEAWQDTLRLSPSRTASLLGSSCTSGGIHTKLLRGTSTRLSSSASGEHSHSAMGCLKQSRGQEVSLGPLQGEDMSPTGREYGVCVYKVKNAEMFKSLKHVSCHQVDPVPVQRQLQQLTLVLERARLHCCDGVVLEEEEHQRWRSPHDAFSLPPPWCLIRITLCILSDGDLRAAPQQLEEPSVRRAPRARRILRAAAGSVEQPSRLNGSGVGVRSNIQLLTDLLSRSRCSLSLH